MQVLEVKKRLDFTGLPFCAHVWNKFESLADESRDCQLSVKKKRVWISAARQKLWSILWEHWLCFFSLCIKIRLDLLTENGPKRFLVLTHCLQMAITRLSFEISLITFFSLKDECHASTSKQKVQSSVARLEYEKKKIGEPTARRTLYNPLFLLLGFWYIKVWLKYT